MFSGVKVELRTKHISHFFLYLCKRKDVTMLYLEKSNNHKTAKKICAYTCENIRLCHSVKLLMFCYHSK